MRHLAAILTYVAALLAAGPSIAVAQSSSSSTCYTVGDSDARAYCLARAHRDPSRCYSIAKPDLRALCRSELGR